MSEKRPYVMRRRRASQAETRQRILEATVQLHEELGPRATTIRAIADRAGVQRLTVYRHFPDETAVFAACTEHWLARHPFPDPGQWQEAGDPWVRLAAALQAHYAYYSETEAMWRQATRDAPAVPALQGPMAAVEAHLDQVAQALHADLALPGPDPGDGLTLRHALAFGTWASLQARALDDAAKARLVLRWLHAPAG